MTDWTVVDELNLARPAHAEPPSGLLRQPAIAMPLCGADHERAQPGHGLLLRKSGRVVTGRSVESNAGSGACPAATVAGRVPGAYQRWVDTHTE